MNINVRFQRHHSGLRDRATRTTATYDRDVLADDQEEQTGAWDELEHLHQEHIGSEVTYQVARMNDDEFRGHYLRHEPYGHG
jgi:hypothetical protein